MTGSALCRIDSRSRSRLGDAGAGERKDSGHGVSHAPILARLVRVGHPNGRQSGARLGRADPCERASGGRPDAPDEIKLFASTMAIARTARETCPGVEFNESYLEGLRLRLHVVEADHDAFAPEAHAVAEVLKRAIAEAPSRQAWCDAVFRLYGPQGRLVRGMLRR